MYTIDHDAAARRLTIVTQGFWTPGVTAAFTAELLARGTAARLRHGPFTVLADLRRAAIQPQAVVDALAAMMPRALKVTSLPIAAVVASNLAKLQTERYLVGARCRTFLDLDEANRWLAAESRAA
ncbi:hypothetical protein [uncultured Sphingomonas sp.]|uniref:hypothetical protein n=1 Tax=uncultured Sphingomonas sp. TaxID=158754 RepID=UPI0025D9818F|nr:hypothetical protein [uncultured Sphingomonas sp.]